MSRRARRNHSPTFKSKVALAAIKGDQTLANQRCLVRSCAAVSGRLRCALCRIAVDQAMALAAARRGCRTGPSRRAPP